MLQAKQRVSAWGHRQLPTPISSWLPRQQFPFAKAIHWRNPILETAGNLARVGRILIISITLIVLTLIPAERPRAAEPDLLQSAPPVVVATVPPAGQTDVAPGPTELRVTFSKPMRDGSWSWVKASDATFPQMSGQPHFTADKRTCVLPVVLAPGRTYVIWLNHAPSQHFQDQTGQPALDYLLVFATRR